MLQKGEVMYRQGFALCTLLLLLTSCAPVSPKTPDPAPPPPAPVAEDAHKLQLIANDEAHLPPTHPASEDITYNSHYMPHFPLEAIRAGHYGKVTLMILVDAKGEISDIRVDQSSGYPELDASAVDAAKHWMFVPAAKNGVPQPGWVRTPVSFDWPLTAPQPANNSQAGAPLQKAYQAERQGDYAAAYALLEPLAQQGNASAQLSVGLLYRNGQGIARDDVQAVLWFRKAAAQGNASAENNLGMMYLDGRGVARDFTQAAMWFQQSALAGSAFGESNFGLAFAQGHVKGKADYVVGYALLVASSARIQAYPGYAAGVSNNLNSLRSVMSAKQITLGEKLAMHVEKDGLATAMSNQWFGANYAVTDPCKPDASEQVCNDEKYRAALKRLDH
jgi:TonB family protein